MVDMYGNWTEEKDYSVYPKEKWCGYDWMAVAIRKDEYEPVTDMKNLITMIFLHAESAVEDGTDIVMDSIDDIVWWVRENGGYKEFDYYC